MGQMKSYALLVFSLIGSLSLVGCDRIVMPGQNISVETVLRSCEEAKYDDPSGITLGIERVHWENKLVTMSNIHIPESQRRMYEQQFTATPQDKYLVFDVYIKNNANKPLAWNHLKAPVFMLKEKNGTTYTSATDSAAMDDMTTKLLTGQSVNPNRTLKGTKVFDVPPSGSYQLEISMGRTGYGRLYGGGAEVMKCIVSPTATK